MAIRPHGPRNSSKKTQRSPTNVRAFGFGNPRRGDRLAVPQNNRANCRSCFSTGKARNLFSSITNLRPPSRTISRSGWSARGRAIRIRRERSIACPGMSGKFRTNRIGANPAPSPPRQREPGTPSSNESYGPIREASRLNFPQRPEGNRSCPFANGQCWPRRSVRSGWLKSSGMENPNHQAIQP